MKYSKQATLDYAKAIDKEMCLEPVNTLIVNEGYNGSTTNFQGDEMIINMDCVEGRVASNDKRSPNKSMDSAFVIQDGSGTTHEIVFVEYRFNYKSMRNLDKSALYGKVNGSTFALKNPTNIHGNYYFVFASNLKQQAIRHLYSLNPKMPQHYAAVDMEDIKSIFF